MVFWIGILVAAGFACFAYKKGFYETCVMLFNIVISIYLAVFLRPVIADIIPAADSTAYNCAWTMIAIATAAFLILYAISYVFLTGQFAISFARIFDTLGAAFLGFLAGYLIYSFLCLLISITPISENTFVKKIGFSNQPHQAGLLHTYWWCNQVDKIVSASGSEYTAEQLVSELLSSVEQKSRPKPGKPVQPSEPNDAETTVIEETPPT